MIDKKLQFVLSTGPDMIKQVTFCFINCCELLGAKVLWNFRSLERKLPYGTFAPRSECAEERKVLLPLPGTQIEDL